MSSYEYSKEELKRLQKASEKLQEKESIDTIKKSFSGNPESLHALKVSIHGSSDQLADILKENGLVISSSEPEASRHPEQVDKQHLEIKTVERYNNFLENGIEVNL